MKKFLLYCLLLAGLITACEDVYYPDIDKVDDVVVVDARIVKGLDDNYISLKFTQGFNVESASYPPVSGGQVELIDDEGNEYKLPEKETGKFLVNVELHEGRQYKLRIDLADQVFESEFENVPEPPVLDTVYGIAEEHVYEVGGSNDAGDFRKVRGVQLYTDISPTSETENYRFSGYGVMQYIWNKSTELMDTVYYYWQKSDVGGIFNLAAPPEYSSSKNIIKHPLYFFNKSVYMEEDHYMAGWILELYQYAISEDSYNYYKDLNAQLDADGRIFDPVYVQARGNLKCLNNPDQIILGNFEISSMTEHRYFIRFISEQQGYEVRKVDDRSPISWMGETMDVPPPFWQW